ncbi:MAG TPA: c(7)-type cytochrome triheme domain-containing protein [Usitatibacter sp.]|nr:c(7)-type cytochrome triheme domain-containing protein [Usitatibacter sp.]
MRRWLLACLGLVAVAHAQAPAPDLRSWMLLDKDGLHDPKGPAVRVLQQPGEALKALAPDGAGNQVRWVEALKQGQINPRSKLLATAPVELRDTEIYLNLRGGTPIVKFPHIVHTQWLACSNCHDHIFNREVGTSPIDMRRILQGEQCGLCHGAVAFPLTECNRCHSVSRIGFRPPEGTPPGARAALVAPPGPQGNR